MSAHGECPIAIYTPNLKGGGAERMMLVLAGALAAGGRRVDLLVDRRTGAYRDDIPAGVGVRELANGSAGRGAWLFLRRCRLDRAVFYRRVLTSPKAAGKLRALPGLVAYLHERRPAAVICALGYTPFLARWAVAISGAMTRVIARQDNALSAKLKDSQSGARKRRKRRRLTRLMKSIYPKLDAVVAVSDGVADDLAATLGMPRDSITTIYNPVIAPERATLAAQPSRHPWLAPGQPPVVLAVGRLNVQKGFLSLLEAFARLSPALDARLLIVGEGPQRRALEARIAHLGIGARVDLPGWVDNPYTLMARCAVFVLSSRYEGLPTALIEAMACGAPVVATDCPSGPGEILRRGALGSLVPVDDIAALSAAIGQAITAAPDTQTLTRRAADFSVARGAAGYIALAQGDVDSASSG